PFRARHPDEPKRHEHPDDTRYHNDIDHHDSAFPDRHSHRHRHRPTPAIPGGSAHGQPWIGRMSRDIKSLTQSAQRWLGLVTLFVAPTSLLTGLCYFFGLVYLRSRLDYFGVDPSTLGLTTADYVVAVVKTF